MNRAPLSPGDAFACSDKQNRKLEGVYLGRIGTDPMWPHRVKITGGNAEGFPVPPQDFYTEERWFTERGLALA